MTFRSAAFSAVTLALALAAGSSQEREADTAELVVLTKTTGGSILPQVLLSVGSPDKPGLASRTCVSSATDVSSFGLARDARFTLSARLAGFVPVTFGPEYPPASAKYEFVVVMNVSPMPAFVRTG